MTDDPHDSENCLLCQMTPSRAMTPEDRARNWHDRLLQAVAVRTTVNWPEFNRVLKEMIEFASGLHPLPLPEKAIVFQRKGIKLERVTNF